VDDTDCARLAKPAYVALEVFEGGEERHSRR
jgi:hypothetical protein